MNRNQQLLELTVSMILINLHTEATDRNPTEAEAEDIYISSELYAYSLLNEFPRLLREETQLPSSIENNVKTTALRILNDKYDDDAAQLESMAAHHAFVFTRELLRELPTIMEHKYV